MAGLKGLSVIVIDDEAAVAAYIGAMLEKLGCHVTGLVCDWTEAETLVGTTAIDAAILDTRLQGRPTDELADLLQSRTIPFAWSTSDGEEAHRPPDRVPLLVKPFAPDALRQMLNSLIG